MLREQVNNKNLNVEKCSRYIQEIGDSQENRHPRKKKMNYHMPVCKLCNSTFEANHLLEDHIIKVHEKTKKFKCDKCEMAFALKWRLHKHTRGHHSPNGKSARNCHYFNNDKVCPFMTIGCKFVHKQDQRSQKLTPGTKR